MPKRVRRRCFMKDITLMWFHVRLTSGLFTGYQ